MAKHQTNQAPLARQIIRRAGWGGVQGLCLTLINRRFVQSALWIGKNHSETKMPALRLETRTWMPAEAPAAGDSQRVRRFHFYWNCLFIMKDPPPPPPPNMQRLYCHIELQYKSVTVFTVNLLISPSCKWPNNSDILNQRGEAGGRGTRRYARLSSSVWGEGFVN